MRRLIESMAVPLMWGDRLLAVDHPDPEMARRGRLLNVMLLALMALVVLLLLVNLLTESGLRQLDYILSDVAAIVWLMLVMWLNRSGRVRAASYIFVFGTLLFILLTFDSRTLLSSGILFVFPLMMGAFLINTRMAMVLFLISTTGYILRVQSLPASEITYLSIFNTGAFLLFALLAVLLASDIQRALRAERARTLELQTLNAELDRRVVERTRDLAEALSREHADASRQQAILTSIADGVIVFNPGGRAELVNPAIAAMLGRQPGALVDHAVADVLDSVRAADRETILAIVRGEGPPRATLKIELDTRTLSVSLANVVSLEELTNAGTVAVFRDITREAELDRMKSDFVSMVSHELRTPMTAIKGYVDLIDSGTAGAITKMQGEFLQIIRSNVGRLTSLVGDLLDLSRIEAGKIQLRFTPVAVPELVRQVAQTLKNQYEEKGLALELDLRDDLPTAYGDADRIIQVLTNLMSNACKYTPQGQVVVRARVDGEFIRVDVQDSGLGISTEAQVRLFTRFYRVRTPETDAISGTGLGLSIVKSLVELHGGQVWVESAPGQGSTFSFTVPCLPAELLDAARAQLRDRSESAETPPAARPLVFIADDDLQAARQAALYLERAGCSVTILTHGEELVASAQREHPALIVLDVLLPGTDGLKLLTELKNGESTCDIPVVLLTMLDQPADGMELGVAGYLTRPADERELLREIKRHLALG
jgi:signal transduction histidine kinase/CheY-like chemotaxis protein